MERIVKLIEDELDRLEEMVALHKWEIDELKEKLKKAEEELENMRRRRPFEEVIRMEVKNND